MDTRREQDCDNGGRVRMCVATHPGISDVPGTRVIFPKTIESASCSAHFEFELRAYKTIKL